MEQSESVPLRRTDNIASEQDLLFPIVYEILKYTLVASGLLVGIYIIQALLFNKWRGLNDSQNGFVSALINYYNFRWRTEDLSCILKNMYDRASKNSIYIGFYIGLRPALLIKDPSTVHDMFDQDFFNFTDRYNDLNYNGNNNTSGDTDEQHGTDKHLQSHNLFVAPYDKWRIMRIPVEHAQSLFNIKSSAGQLIMNLTVLLSRRIRRFCCLETFHLWHVAYTMERHVSNCIQQLAFGIYEHTTFEIDVIPNIDLPKDHNRVYLANDQSAVKNNINLSPRNNLVKINNLSSSNQSANLDALLKPIEVFRRHNGAPILSKQENESFHPMAQAWCKENKEIMNELELRTSKPSVGCFRRKSIDPITVNQDLEDYYMKITNKIVANRERIPKINKNQDFMQMLLCLRNNGFIKRREDFEFKVNSGIYYILLNSINLNLKYFFFFLSKYERASYFNRNNCRIYIIMDWSRISRTNNYDDIFHV